MNLRHHTGRHFLRSDSVAKTMVKAANISTKEIVLEIGTGKCAITSLLGGKNVITYETDKQMHKDATSILKKFPNIKAICDDGFKSNEYFDVFISSLPYSQSRRAIEWLVQKKFSRAVIMVQKEFAEKLFAVSGKQRKAVSVLACHGFETKLVSTVPKDSFDPPPAVESVILNLVQKQTISLKTIMAVNKIFSYRRKTLCNIPGLSRYGSDTRLDDLNCDEIIEVANSAF